MNVLDYGTGFGDFCDYLEGVFWAGCGELGFVGRETEGRLRKMGR
jgi:hypothetical protein